MNTTSRYDRQSILPEIGVEGQRKISASSVLCVGAGGLGCPALLYLAAAGVGHIGIIDFDTVELSNLQRQTLFTTDDIGQNKAEAAKTRLNALNPDIKITAYTDALTDQNAEDLFSKYDITLDGTDNFEAKFLINDAAVKTGTPFIYGSILGFDGQVSTFNHDSGPCYRCLFPAPPQNDIPNCAEAGVIGAVAGIIGTTQAMEAIKVIVNHDSFKPLSHALWTIDMRTMENSILSLPKNPQCPTCSKDTDDITLEYKPPLCSAIAEISAQDAKANTTATFIDVREINEWQTGHIEDAIHVPLSDLKAGKIPDLSPDQEIIIYCQKGLRGKKAIDILKDQGYTNATNMSDGYDAWCSLS